MRRFVPVAEVARPHGVKGELRLRLFNEGSAVLGPRSAVRLRFPDGSERESVLLTAREVPKALLVTLPDVADRDAAEAMRGAMVCVDRERFPPLDEGEFYACDVEGAEAVLAGGERVGVVRELRSYPTCDVLVIERDAGSSLEVPLVEAYVSAVEPEARRVVLATVEGLG